nr:hypothetical protein Iba_chr07bCG10810 [Ipomoea batatas]
MEFQPNKKSNRNCSGRDNHRSGGILDLRRNELGTPGRHSRPKVWPLQPGLNQLPRTSSLGKIRHIDDEGFFHLDQEDINDFIKACRWIDFWCKENRKSISSPERRIENSRQGYSNRADRL